MSSSSQILLGDAKHVPLEAPTFQCVVTSPPYWGLRTYGSDEREIGQGSLEEYLNDLLEVSREVERVLLDDGVFWLNLGDTASGSGGAGGDYNSGGSKQGLPRYRQGATSVPPMSWCLIPQRVALMLVEEGWLLRAWVTWDKGAHRRESLDHARRPGVQSEVILMLVKQRRYKFYADRLEESGDVWHFRPSQSRRGHLAPFPDELPRRAILPSTDLGDLVFDPFSGSGTTVRVANELGRVGVGLDLYPFQIIS